MIRVVASGLVAASLGSTTAGALTAPVPNVGMVTDLTWGISRADMHRTVGMLSAAWVRSVRLNVSWSGMERDGKGC